MKLKPHDIDKAKYLEWTIGTDATNDTVSQFPHRTVEWRFVSKNMNRVGIGQGKFIVFAGNIDSDVVSEYKGHIEATVKPKKTKTVTSTIPSDGDSK